MPEYCSIGDVKDRLTDAGYKFAADRDGDGAVSSREAEKMIAAIEWAGTVLDEAVTAGRLITASDVREQGSTILKHLGVDLASYRFAGNGGRKVPQSLKDAYEDAMERIARYLDGAIVDDLAYPEETAGANLPRAIDPAKRVTRRYHRRRRQWPY